MLEGDVKKLSTSFFATLGWTELKAQCSFNQLLLLKQHGIIFEMVMSSTNFHIRNDFSGSFKLVINAWKGYGSSYAL